jgi:hypothetical protein
MGFPLCLSPSLILKKGSPYLNKKINLPSPSFLLKTPTPPLLIFSKKVGNIWFNIDKILCHHLYPMI